VRRRSLATALPLVALLCGCGGTGEAGEVYPLAARDVRQILIGLELPDMMAQAATDVRVTQDGDGGIIWYLGADDRYVLRFIARTEAIDAGHTRVTLELKPPTDAPDDPAKGTLEANPGAVHMYRVSMLEQIDSTLENRPYDRAKVVAETTVGVASDMDEATVRIGEQAARYREQEAHNMTDAYAREGHDTWSEPERETAMGTPMNDGEPTW
jgi:hypothetical protein